jgi:HD-GYP domain-containing protein (c-di-GMP phosphodiesterase class II)
VGGETMRLVSIDMLDNGMILAKDIIYKDMLVLKKGSRNIHQYINRLNKMGIRYLYVEDSICDDIMVPDVISDDTRKLCKKTLINTMRSLDNHEDTPISRLNSSIEHIIYDITTKNIKHSLADIRTIDEYTFSHCISTTVYALLIGKELNYSKSMMEQLAIGTMLHDIGKVLLDSNILYKKEELTYSEMEYVKKHVLKGYDYIRDRTDIPEASKNIVLRHHERLDGSGYPHALKGNQLEEYSRIAGIADVYDALVSDRCYRKKWKTNKAIKFLLENSDVKFDADLVRIFMNNIAVYPNGSTIRLSDGRMALVKEQNRNIPLRPIIKVFADQWGHILPIEEIDLLKVLSITIVDAELEVYDNSAWVTIDI